MITAQEHTDQLFETFRSSKDIEKEMFHVEGLIFDHGRKLVRLSDELNMGADFSNTILEYRYRLGTDFIDVIFSGRQFW